MKSKNVVQLAVVLLFVCGSCQTYTVPGDFPDIQTALDSVPPVSTIVLADGTYYENLVWPAEKSGIELQSANRNPEHCVIDGSLSPEPVVSLLTTRDLELDLEGIQFRGGTGEGTEKAGGLHLMVDGVGNEKLDVYIGNCVVRENSEGGLFFGHPDGIGGSVIYLSDSVIESNTVTDTFGAVGIAGNAILNMNEIQDNGSVGVFAYSETPGYLVMSGNTVARNRCSEMGGGIWIGGEYTVQIRDNTISDNTGDIMSISLMVGAPLLGVSSAIGGVIEHNWIDQVGELEQPVVGIQVYEPTDLTVKRNFIHHNQGEFDGWQSGVGIIVGELFGDEPLFQASGMVSIVNNWIYRNDAGILVNNAGDGSTHIINNTVVYSDYVGISALEGSKQPSVYNSIVGNWGSEPALAGDLLGVTKVTFSDLEQLVPGEGNISFDPFFVDSASDDFHLTPDSVCIDSGTSEIPIGDESDSGVPDDDIDEDVRDREKPDIGADEFFAASNGCERC